MLLSRAALASFQTLRTITVKLDENTEVRLRYPTMQGRGLVERMFRDKREEDLRAYSLACTMCDDAGVLLFNPTSEADIREINELPADVFAVIADAATPLFGWTKDEKEKIEKN